MRDFAARRLKRRNVILPEKFPMFNMLKNVSSSTKFRITLLVAALGYFVDVFDIVLFLMVRVSSLTSLGLSGRELLEVGARLYNIQLVGMLIGGLIWGIIGDKIGRVQVLFGTILLYSAANIANAFVTTVDGYAICRFISGFGLAGEVGAAVTLIAEIMSKAKRGIGTTIVATAGTCGAITASLTGQIASWQNSYIIGGLLGLILLILRFGVAESGMFASVKAKTTVKRGDFRLIISSREKFISYITCILSGTPLFFTLYVLITFAPELGEGLGIQGKLVTAKASLYFTSAMAVGDFACGLFSQYLRSRKKALFCFVTMAFVCTAILLSLNEVPAQLFYLMCIPTGFFNGYWAVYVSTVVEQFGTNLRSTTTTSVLNFVRATPIIMSFTIIALQDTLGVVRSMQLVGLLAFGCSFYFLGKLRETFSDDLNYVEQPENTLAGKSVG